MLLKRKRSESEFSHSSCSTGSASNSPPRPDASVFSFAQMENTSPFRRSVAPAPSHLPSRTMKRFRDNRPSEEEVHQRTINMLFSAAQRPEAQQHEAAPPQHYHQHPESTTTQQQQLQASLHNFWKLPNPQSLIAASAPAAQPPYVDASIYAPSDCEDCGRGLRSDDDMMVEEDMDMDGGAPQTSCMGCGKHVCSHCSITNMGERRRCLTCADSTARKPVWMGGGGIGWASSSRGSSSFGFC